MKPGEDSRTALRRELEEEFGIDVSVGKFVGEVWQEYVHIAIRLMAFEVRVWSGQWVMAEHQAVVWEDWDALSSYDLAEADRRLIKIMEQT